MPVKIPKTIQACHTHVAKYFSACFLDANSYVFNVKFSSFQGTFNNYSSSPNGL